VHVSPGRGREQARRLLTALALYTPLAPSDGPSPNGRDAELSGRVIPVDLD
jgi:hypothetical protein